MTSSITLQCKAFLTNFEMACEFGIITILADLIWLAHDCSRSGFDMVYGVVGAFLLIGLIGTARVLYNHHHAYVAKRLKAHTDLGE